MLHARHAVCAALTLLFACTHALAAPDGPPTCSGHVNGQWQPLDSDSMMSCFKHVDESVVEYNAQGFKFGLWGRTLLSADRYYFYSSADGGKNWQAVGLKTELTQTTENVPPPPASAAADTSGAAAGEDDSMPAGTTMPAQTAGSEPATTETASAAPAASAPAPVVAQKPSAQTLPAGDRRNCSIHAGSNWELIARLTLEECARELDNSSDSYDANGFKYAYWSGVFLAANATEVLKSSDSHKWDLVLMRSER